MSAVVIVILAYIAVVEFIVILAAAGHNADLHRELARFRRHQRLMTHMAAARRKAWLS